MDANTLRQTVHTDCKQWHIVILLIFYAWSALLYMSETIGKLMSQEGE